LGIPDLQERGVICVNEEAMEWDECMTIQDVLDRRKYTFPLIVVKVDGEVVRKEQYTSFLVPDGADVKVIHLIGGG
jgi:thiamine biosynthesis protein ThiS